MFVVFNVWSISCYLSGIAFWCGSAVVREPALRDQFCIFAEVCSTARDVVCLAVGPWVLGWQVLGCKCSILLVNGVVSSSVSLPVCVAFLSVLERKVLKTSFLIAICLYYPSFLPGFISCVFQPCFGGTHI